MQQTTGFDYNHYKSNYKNKIILFTAMLKNNFAIISNYTHKIVTYTKYKLIIPNSVHIFKNHLTTCEHVIPNNINKYDVSKNYNCKKKLLNTIYINNFYGISNINNFLLENINKIEICQLGNRVIKQNMLYLKNIKNIFLLNNVNCCNIQLLKNIYSFCIRSDLLCEDIQNIFFLNNLCVLSIYNSNNLNDSNNVKVNLNKIKQIYKLSINLQLDKNTNANNLMYVSKLQIYDLNLLNIYAIGTVHELSIHYLRNRHIRLAMLKNIKNITIFTIPSVLFNVLDTLDISCLKNIHTFRITHCRTKINIQKPTNIYKLHIISHGNNYGNDNVCNIYKLKNVHTLITNVKLSDDCILNNCVKFIGSFLSVDIKKIQCIKHIKNSKW